jgi:hypothetical protein
MVRYNQVVSNIKLLPNFLTYYEKELEEAKKDCIISGSLEKQVQRLPGITEHRFNQLQEIEALLNYMNIEHRRIRKIFYMKYLEKYAKALSSRDAQIYADAEDDVIDSEVLINELALLRNKYLGILKAIESKNFQLGHIARLRTAGLSDIQI